MNVRQRLWWVLGGVCLLFCVGFVFATYRFGWSTTGFLKKSLWDWLQLLIVPLMLAVVALVFQLANSRTERQATKQRYEQDQQIALNKQQADILQAYLDRMSELLLINELRSSAVDAEVRTVARVLTITTLFQLDARRIAYVFTFLRESGLMFTKPNSSIVSLIQADLKNINFSHANLSEADLRGADLREANLKRANLSRADLSEADLRKANLRDADLREANLKRANLSEAHLIGARLENAHLEGAHLEGARLAGRMSQVNLSGADLSGADLSVTNFTEDDHKVYINAGLIGAKLSGAKLSGAKLSGASFRNANLNGADLSVANLSDAYLIEADLSNADLSGANLSAANLNGANLSGAKLNGANLSAANLSEADLNGANLSSSNLNGADFSGTNLRKAYLGGADLSKAKLDGADLGNAKVTPKLETSAKGEASLKLPNPYEKYAHRQRPGRLPGPMRTFGGPLRLRCNVTYARDEETVRYIQRSKFVLIGNLLVPLLIFLILIVSIVYFPLLRLAIAIAMFVMLLVIAHTIIHYVDDVYILTTRRIIDINRKFIFFEKEHLSIEYGQIKDLKEIVGNPIYSALDVGKVIIEAPGLSPGLIMDLLDHPSSIIEMIYVLYRQHGASKEQQNENAG